MTGYRVQTARKINATCKACSGWGIRRDTMLSCSDCRGTGLVEVVAETDRIEVRAA